MNAALLELLVGFAGSRRDVGSHRAIGHQARFVDTVGVVARPVFAMHPAQHRVRPGLGGACTCWRRAAKPAINPSRSSKIHGLGPNWAQPLDGRFVQQPSHKIRQPHPPIKIASPTAQVDATRPLRYFAARARTCSITRSGVALRLRPPTNGMMQNEQRLLQPSWIFRLGRAVAGGVLNRRGQNKSRKNVADLNLPV